LARLGVLFYLKLDQDAVAILALAFIGTDDVIAWQDTVDIVELESSSNRVKFYVIVVVVFGLVQMSWNCKCLKVDIWWSVSNALDLLKSC
jgi:hypothetical protein